jgi:hypothetical protein
MLSYQHISAVSWSIASDLHPMKSTAFFPLNDLIFKWAVSVDDWPGRGEVSNALETEASGSVFKWKIILCTFRLFSGVYPRLDRQPFRHKV